MTREAYLNYCAGLPGAVVDQPFPADFQSWVARHWDSLKWFALVMKVDGRDAVNLKCSPKMCIRDRGYLICPHHPLQHLILRAGHACGVAGRRGPLREPDAGQRRGAPGGKRCV